MTTFQLCFVAQAFFSLACDLGALYCAVRSYTSKKVDEISVPIGSVVEVLRKSDNGWWLIRYVGLVCLLMINFYLEN